MPRYLCTKEVWAVKIQDIHENRDHAVIVPEGNYGSFVVSLKYLRKHDPQPGGYFVRYKDGYQSFSPADAFEEGYRRVA